MKNTLFLTLSLLLLGTLNAQGNAVLHSSGTSKIYFGYYAYDQAYNASVSGDTIYLSGGQYAVSQAINKKLTIIGAGYFPDSTKVTGKTYLESTVSLKTGSSGSWLEGLFLAGNIDYGYYDSVNNIRIHRCFLNGSIQTPQGTGYINKNLTITECNFVGFNGGNTISNLYVGNSVIRYTLSNIDKPALVENCYFYTGSYNHLFYNFQWVTIRNSIINNSLWPGNTVRLVYNSKFSNNLWTNTPGGTYLSNDTLKEQIGVVFDSLFVNVPALGYEWNYDFHLKPSTASKYKGTDGSEVSLYGGNMCRWKEGAVPRNPHIQAADIDEKTDNAGKLKINIKVQAQKR